MGDFGKLLYRSNDFTVKIGMTSEEYVVFQEYGQSCSIAMQEEAIELARAILRHYGEE